MSSLCAQNCSCCFSRPSRSQLFLCFMLSPHRKHIASCHFICQVTYVSVSSHPPSPSTPTAEIYRSDIVCKLARTVLGGCEQFALVGPVHFVVPSTCCLLLPLFRTYGRDKNNSNKIHFPNLFSYYRSMNIMPFKSPLERHARTNERRQPAILFFVDASTPVK